MQFGLDEVGFSMFYSIICFIVEKFESGPLNDRHPYHLFMLISTSIAQEKVKRVLRQNNQSLVLQSFCIKAVKMAVY